jgi:4-hydroxy-3-methylbut-2-enyl diphosphate reductase
MQVELASESGFCFGVRRAIQLATETLRQRPAGTVCSLGPLIHNPQEVARLEAAGLRVIERLAQIDGGTVVIRSHGADPSVVADARRRGIEVVDATCPLVARVQQRAARLGEAGYQVLILGDRGHPEVQAVAGHCPGAVVIGDASELAGLSLADRVGAVAQTTASQVSFHQVAAALRQLRIADLRVYKTICNATARRQEAARQLARRVDRVVVLGGHNSANTRALAQICRGVGVRTIHVETVAELQEADFDGARTVGVTAGASTPDWVIDQCLQSLGGGSEKVSK